MAAFTSSASGNWSTAATWGGAGVPGAGDTVSIGAHTVTVDVDTSVGTSPNDITTKVIDLTSATSRLVVGATRTLTILGNRGAVNSATFEQLAGSTVRFDNSASGGAPIYRDINGGFTKYLFTGTPGSPVTIEAIAGQTWLINVNWNGFTAVYTTFRRSGTFACATVTATGTSITNCTFDACGTVNLSQNSATLNFTFDDNVITGTTHATDSLLLNQSAAPTSAVKSVRRNWVEKAFTNLGKGLIVDDNYFGGITCFTGGSTTFARTPRNNWIDNTLNLNGGNGMVLVGSWDGLYCTSSANGNPHFLAPKTVVGDALLRRMIFESRNPDVVDTGDCVVAIGTCCASGTAIVIENSVVLKSSTANVTSGQLLTSFSPPATAATHKIRIRRCTANQNKTGVAGVGLRAVLAYAEGGTGAAGQIPEVRGVLAWADAPGNGYLAERISGTVGGVITAAGANFNWRHNIDAGDNGRGYEDRANSPGQDLWAGGVADGGDAAAAGVDDDQGSGDPQFLDANRNVTAWAVARGYGTTYADALTAVRTNRTRIRDLIDYVFEGFKVQSVATRTAGGDAVPVGAGTWHRSRDLSRFAAFRSAIGV